MSARVLMIQGTMSSVGKSTLVAGLCRLFSQDGWRVAPFKAQNMALNAAVTLDGLEVGRAQAMQAEAAGVEVSVAMNPILIKPESGGAAQVILQGRPWGRLVAGEQPRWREEWWRAATGALDALRSTYDLVLIEGAGGPAELNLRPHDLANMAIAAYAGAPVLLVGDIERGGIFAQLLGTLALLPQEELRLVRGLLVNKFHGDPRLFDEGVHILAERSGLPVLGVIPYLHQLLLPEEDSLSSPLSAVERSTALLDVAVLKLPHLSNADDLDPLRAEEDTHVRFVSQPGELGAPDLLIIPGTKQTIGDLRWLRAQGWDVTIRERARAGMAIVGLCGGYQLLGTWLDDPAGVEGYAAEESGLGLLPVVTTFQAEKTRRRVSARVVDPRGLLAGAGGLDLDGYELHHGVSRIVEPVPPLLALGANASEHDGVLAPGGWVLGTYLHGIFAHDELRGLVLRNLARHKGRERVATGQRFARGASYDRLAATLRERLDLALIEGLLAGPPAAGRSTRC